MAPDERDRTFEKALSRHVRSSASAGANANLSSGPTAQDFHCLDPEILAAYHERSLLPDEMNFCKEHIVGCAHCQAILAELEATDSIPLQVSEKEEAMLTRIGQPVMEADGVRGAAQATFPEKSRVSRLSIGVRWRWLAPAGALAAGLLAWIAWHENQPLKVKPPAEVNVARIEQHATSAPPATRREAPASPSSDQLAGLSKDQGAIGGVAPEKTARETKSLKQIEKLDSRMRASLPKASTDKENGTHRDTERDSSLGASLPPNQPALDAKAGVAGAMPETVEVQTQAANVPAQNQLNAQKIAGPSPLSQAEQTKKNKSESLGRNYRATAPAPAPPGAAGFTSALSMQMAAISNPHRITSPDGKAIWRAGRAGLIEFSADNGASWLRQTSGVLADLTAGSSPSGKICWIVGRAGTILLTTDAGLHWAVIHSPTDEDLGGVRALDALHATIWNLGNTKVFETSDGGATWRPTASK